MVKHVPYSQLDVRTRRSLLVRSVARASATALILAVAYFVVPLEEVRDLGSVLFLATVLVVVLVVCVWQGTRVVRADYPAVQALEALAAVVPIYLLGFSVTYYLVAATSASNFSEPVSRMGSLYFTLSVFSTVGFGDITASTDFARAVVSLQMVGNLVIIAFGGRLLVAAVRRAQARRDTDT